jgi:hypothetical protein
MTLKRTNIYLDDGTLEKLAAIGKQRYSGLKPSHLVRIAVDRFLEEQKEHGPWGATREEKKVPKPSRKGTRKRSH